MACNCNNCFERPNVDVNEKLRRVCGYLRANNQELKSELLQVLEILERVENSFKVYSDKKMIELHISTYCQKIELPILRTLMDELEEIKPGSAMEFVQGVDFTKIIEQLLSVNRDLNNDTKKAVLYVWEIRKKIRFIIYQIDRIDDTDIVEKQMSILCGMIAFY